MVNKLKAKKKQISEEEKKSMLSKIKKTEEKKQSVNVNLSMCLLWET